MTNPGPPRYDEDMDALRHQLYSEFLESDAFKALSREAETFAKAYMSSDPMSATRDKGQLEKLILSSFMKSMKSGQAQSRPVVDQEIERLLESARPHVAAELVRREQGKPDSA